MFHDTNINLLVCISQIAYTPYSILWINVHILWIVHIYHLWNSQLFLVFYSSHFYHASLLFKRFYFFDLFVQSLAVLRKCCNFAPKKKICEKMELPNDPMMLMSVINTKLRDEYSTLDALCEDMQISREEVVKKLAEAGFEYNPAANKFW